MRVSDSPIIEIRNPRSFYGGAFTASGSFGNLSWTANEAYAYAFKIHGDVDGADYVCVSAFWINGTTALAGNFEVGIYDEGNSLLASTGAIAQATANAIQTPSLSVTLPMGRYKLAIAGSSTGRLYGNIQNPQYDMRAASEGWQTYMASGYPLPSTWSPANNPNVNLPLIGIARVTM